MIKWEVSMNKILITILISMFLPAFATCPIDSDKPCTGEKQTQEKISKINKPDLKQNDDVKDYPFLPKKEKVKIQINDTQNQSYDPDCMFGVCLP